MNRVLSGDSGADRSDRDDFWDGNADELIRWNGISATAWNTNHDGDAFPNGLVDADSDNDGLDDGDEFTSTQTRPDKPDTDGDGLTDHQEVVQFGGRFNPNDPDTDHDGTNDFVEAFPQGDADEDGLSNADESAKGTNPTKPDTDCDGARDGPEANYWGGAWNAGYGATPFNRLLNADVDGDGLIDGLEIGTVSAPRGAVYRTNPAVWDTDQDGLGDTQEDSNKLTVQCGSGPAMSSSSSGAWAPPEPGPPFWDVVAGIVPQTTLSSETLLVDADKIHYVVNQTLGPFLLGGYGVALFPAPAASAPDVSPPGMMTASSSSTSVPTNPTNPDTDRDGVRDGLEVQSGTNPGRAGSSESGQDAAACDTDNDLLGDGAEVGIPGTTGNPSDPCTHRDADPATRTDPLDADSDDDGGSDDTEVLNGWDPACYDTDQDGLSDGLETGVETPWPSTPVIGGTNQANYVTVGGRQWPTWQRWQGLTLNGVKITTFVTDRDSDDDGLVDGLEDINHNGRFGMGGPLALHDTASELGGREETNPREGDSDGDKLLDGREILIYGPYTFNEALGSWGGSLNKLVFSLSKASNAWITDPVSPYSDLDENDLVQVPDGTDLNPRGDAFLELQFGLFHTLEQNDCCGANRLELYLDQFVLDVPVSNSDFSGGMGPDAAASISNPRSEKLLPNSLIDSVKASIVGGAANLAWKKEKGESPQFLRLNLPEEFKPETGFMDLSVEFYLGARDRDLWGQHDEVDLNTRNLHERRLKHEWGLDHDARGSLNGTGGYLVQEGLETHVGSLRDDRGSDVDASLGVTVADSVPSYFMQGLQEIRRVGQAAPLSGRCLGEPGCVR